MTDTTDYKPVAQSKAQSMTTHEFVTRDPMPGDEHAIDLEARFYVGGQPSRIDGTYQYEFEPYLADDLLRAIHTHLGTKTAWDRRP